MRGIAAILICLALTLQACSHDIEQPAVEIPAETPDEPSVLIAAHENRTIEESRFGVHLGDMDYEQAAPFIRELGDIHVREELWEDSGWRMVKTDWLEECRKNCVPTDFSDCDCEDGPYYADMHPGIDYVSGISFYDNGFSLLVTILNYTNSPEEKPLFESTYFPDKAGVYTDYLDYLLEGMPDVRYWEIGNEVDLPFWAGTLDNYLEMVRTSVKKIKSVCPDCQIGVSFNSAFESLNDKWRSVLKQLGEDCDFIDAHLLPTAGMSLEKAQKMDLSGWNELCSNARLISTETGIPDHPLHTDWGDWRLGGTPRKQAEDLVKYSTVLFERGYDKVFFFLSDFDFEPIDNDLFEHTGLIDDNFEVKPSCIAYKTLIRMVDGFSKVVKVTDGCYLYTFTDSSGVYVVWDSGTGLPDEISGDILVTDIKGNSTIVNSSAFIPENEPCFIRIID